jgi:hypothetical protein
MNQKQVVIVYKAHKKFKVKIYIKILQINKFNLSQLSNIKIIILLFYFMKNNILIYFKFKKYNYYYYLIINFFWN